MSKRQNSLFAEVRRQEISELVQREGKVTVNALCERFSVSPATVRTDLTELEAMGDGSKQYLVDFSLKRENPTRAENFGNSNPVQLRS